MKLGIKKMEYIFSEGLKDYGYLAPGASLDISSFIRSGYAFAALPFTPETGNLEEEWTVDEDGQKSLASFSASIRADRESYRSLLQRLLGRKAVWKITLVSGKEYIIGSREYVPTFSWSDGVSGISSSEFSVSIRNESLHGVLFNIPG